MKRALVALVAVTAAVVAYRQIKRPTAEPTVPYYNYN
jgi:hypothetical protein